MFKGLDVISLGKKAKILIKNLFKYDLTFYIDLCRGVVCSQRVGSYTGVPAGVVFKCFSNHQSVQVTITTDLDIRAVVQLPPLTKPPVQWKREDGMLHVNQWEYQIIELIVNKCNAVQICTDLSLKI